MDIPPGKYVANWLDPVQGTTVGIAAFSHSGGVKELKVPDEFASGVALRVTSVKE